MVDTILIVDDEEGIRESLRGVLEDEGFAVQTVNSGEDCLKLLEKTSFKCILLDIWLPGIDGLDTLKKIRFLYPEISVIMISGHGTIEMAVRATRRGAIDFIEKPLHLEKILSAVRSALKFHNTTQEKKFENGNKRDYRIIGESVPMRALRQQIELAAPTNGRVLIYGETGTGKELVARALHSKSLRNENPFVAINCAAIPEELIESELLGHVKGAFTGATNARHGKFEQANGGTLFLDEIGDMSLKTQAKLLRVLEEQSFEQVGGYTSISVDVRVIAATNKRLDEEIERNTFRTDLFYRLNVIPFQIPPLREHIEDIPALIEYFVDYYSEMYERPKCSFTSNAMEKMIHYFWPGNVRELRSVIERLIIMVNEEQIDSDNLPFASTEGVSSSSYQFDSYKEASEAYEREFLQRKLSEYNGNVTHTAEAIGIDRSHFYRRIKALGISIRG